MILPAPNPSVQAVLQTYPIAIRQKILEMRSLIYQLAAGIEAVGKIEESLKWGQPSYVPVKPNCGTPLRLGWHLKKPQQFGLYVHCQTNLIASFQSQIPTNLTFDGTRGILFDQDHATATDEIRWFIAEALTYHLKEPNQRFR